MATTNVLTNDDLLKHVCLHLDLRSLAALQQASTGLGRVGKAQAFRPVWQAQLDAMRHYFRFAAPFASPGTAKAVENRKTMTEEQLAKDHLRPVDFSKFAAPVDDSLEALKESCKVLHAFSQTDGWTKHQESKNVYRDEEGVGTLVMVVGSRGAGKSYLVATYLNDHYSTIPPEAGHWHRMAQHFAVESLGVKFSTQLWDFIPRMDFAPLWHVVTAHCLIFCIDVTDEKSLEYAKRYMAQTDLVFASRELRGVPRPPVFLAATKTDAKWVLKKDDLKALAKEYGMDYYETSSSTNLGLKELFLSAVGQGIAYHKFKSTLAKSTAPPEGKATPSEEKPRVHAEPIAKPLLPTEHRCTIL